MVNKEYTINMNGVKDLVDYFKKLRIQEGLTCENIKLCTEVAGIKGIEEGNVKLPRLETFLRLASFWNLSDEQIVEIYKTLSDRERKLKIVGEAPYFQARNIQIDLIKFQELPEKLKILRKQQGLSMADVERKSGVIVTTIYETEQMGMSNSLRVLIPLCKVYGISNEQVLDFYHGVTKKANTRKPVDLDELSNKELSEIILKQNARTNKFYSEKVKVLQKGRRR
jgi:hypothetical protein